MWNLCEEDIRIPPQATRDLDVEPSRLPGGEQLEEVMPAIVVEPVPHGEILGLVSR